MNSYQSRLKQKMDLQPHLIAVLAVILLILGAYAIMLNVKLDRAPSLTACSIFFDQLEASEVIE